ncbi:MAG: efflux transporter periplasmic adaptor subunit, partial [Gammaproteobacteria bacterium]|nr:efflux transporter periplasmic adaptor subunit [Gammaproteobacteria bacterium]
MKYVLLLVLALAAVAGGVWYVTRDGGEPTQAGASAGGFGGRQAEVPLVSVEPVRRDTLTETVEAIGTALA